MDYLSLYASQEQGPRFGNMHALLKFLFFQTDQVDYMGFTR
jgi:hypothetical protein